MRSTNFDNLIAIYDYRDPSTFVYNSDLVTFTEFGAQLKDLVPENVVLGATYWESSDANYGDNSIDLSANITGTVNIQEHKLALLGGQFAKTLTYQAAHPFDDIVPTGSITFQYFPNFSNIPNNTQYIFHWGQEELEEDVFVKKNYLEILHTSTGDIIYNIYDKAGNKYQTKKDSVVVEDALHDYEFKFLWDSFQTEQNEARIKLYLYFEGELLDTYDLEADTFNLSDIVNIGFGNAEPPFPNFFISNLLIERFAEVTAEMVPATYEPRKYLPMQETRYTTTPQKIETVNNLTIETIKKIEVLINRSSDSKQYIGYTFKLGDKEYFFDRTSLTWKPHEHPEDISDLDSMMEHKDELITSGTLFKCIPYLRSVDGKGTPQITTMIVIYDEFVPCIEVSPVALVYGYVKDVLGEPVCNAKILITPSKSSVAHAGNYILPKLTKVIRTGQKGYWDAELVLSSAFDPEILYNIQIIVRDSVVYQRANIKVFREGTIKFDDLIEENNSDY